MQNPNEKPKYIEDSFELEEFKERFNRSKRINAKIRTDKKNIRRLSALSVVLLFFAVFFAYQVLDYYAGLNQNARINEKAREIAEVEAPKPAVPAQPPVEPEPVEEEAESVPEPEPRVVLDKILNLREAFSNDDIMGYLKIDGTNIDYVVAQAADNEYYLRRDLSGEKSNAGTVFMDYECDAYELSRNTVIYGHNMRNGSMFHNLRYYNDREFYNNHRYISLTTPYEETIWEVFAFYNTTTTFNYIQVIFPDDASFEALLSEMKGKSLYDTGVEVGPEDKILSLSTCANTTDDARLVLNAKLVN